MKPNAGRREQEKALHPTPLEEETALQKEGTGEGTEEPSRRGQGAHQLEGLIERDHLGERRLLLLLQRRRRLGCHRYQLAS
jgi:hypothetical protein